MFLDSLNIRRRAHTRPARARAAARDGGARAGRGTGERAEASARGGRRPRGPTTGRAGHVSLNAHVHVSARLGGVRGAPARGGGERPAGAPPPGPPGGCASRSAGRSPSRSRARARQKVTVDRGGKCPALHFSDVFLPRYALRVYIGPGNLYRLQSFRNVEVSSTSCSSILFGRIMRPSLAAGVSRSMDLCSEHMFHI